jgi:hypothetical protein
MMFPLDDFPLKKGCFFPYDVKGFYCKINFAKFSWCKIGEETKEIENGEYGVYD